MCIRDSYNDVTKDKLVLLPVFKTLMLLTGQKPQIILAKESIAAFKIRKNMEIGAKVTVRNYLNSNLLKLIFLNLPKFHFSNYCISLKFFDLFYPPLDQRTGADILINIKGENKETKNFYLSSLLIY